MAEITVSINSRAFQIVCADGEEAHVMRLAEDLSSRVSALRRSSPSTSDTHLLVLASLTLCNELGDLQRDIGALKTDITKAESAREKLSERLTDMENTLADAINALAARLEQSPE